MYTDLSQFNAITINNLQPIMTNRVTLSFWTQISNIQGMSNSIINLSVKQFLVVSLGAFGTTGIQVFCTPNQKYLPFSDNQTSNTGLNVSNLGPAASRVSNQIPFAANSASSYGYDGRWFHTRCAISYDQNSMYLNNYSWGQDQLVSQTISTERLYNSPSNVDSDNHFKYFFRSGEMSTFQISNNNNISVPIYLRNIYIFREYIPVGIKLEHFSLKDIITHSDLWPELLFSLQFDDLTNSGSSYSVNYQSYTLGSAPSSVSLILYPTGTPDLSSPKNFKLLPQITTGNQQFTTISLELPTSSISCNPTAKTQFCFDSDKAMVCKANNWLGNIKLIFRFFGIYMRSLMSFNLYDVSRDFCI